MLKYLSDCCWSFLRWLLKLNLIALLYSKTSILFEVVLPLPLIALLCSIGQKSLNIMKTA